MKDEGAEPYPSKRLGQHFLRDQRTINRIIEALAPKPDETIVEIGPGTGALTAVLVERCGPTHRSRIRQQADAAAERAFRQFLEFQTGDG